MKKWTIGVPVSAYVICHVAANSKQDAIDKAYLSVERGAENLCHNRRNEVEIADIDYNIHAHAVQDKENESI